MDWLRGVVLLEGLFLPERNQGMFVWGFFGCLMGAAKEAMLQRTSLEMEFLGIFGNTSVSLLCLPV